jgi:MFS superfamily sulfate permease-like transporter
MIRKKSHLPLVMFIPSSVIHGFTLGVAFIIGLNQINFIFGINPKERHVEFINNLIESLKILDETNGWALG